ncbi:polymorphic toxin-type HINT domain-containing protein [Krasilnikoviella flava]|uniref:RHS repeat-associated core domain-containing protein n=1 Tax=Krasilnikoviella flava TaxID=526729 RepID=A0A1T5M3S2_9MICO|nr:polymorphic toxin-type HINT domain-containing protein [Krasilnikoviella flava]SKC82765.1 RHS repeat-associated core domain-containing protein [Krasilnikoviella flava]
MAEGLTVAAEGSPTVLMVTAGVSGDSGSFGASSLSPSNTWSTDLRSGSFAWNYPLSAPDVPGSFTPNLGISYSSGGIDGRTSSTNNQASQVGDGFDLWPGFIERKYKSCGLDEVKNDAGRPIGDLCWDYDNAFISFNGVAGELVPSGTDTWRLQKDDGTKIERLRSTARGNSDNDGEYWKVTTPNGTQYFFGYNRLPGWQSGDAVTASTWTVPVVGDDAGDECHAATRKASLCRQAWRWNLDYTVDAAGNKITYHYAAERNQYGQLGDPATDNVYHRGGTLTRIDYGLRGADLVGAGAAQPLGRVSFTSAERCLASGGVQCTNIATQPSGWFDTPWDLNCNAGATCDEGRTSPSFWTRKMLTKITTQVFADTGSGAAWQNVDSWTLGHRWGIADSDYQLLLTSITRTGHTGTTAIAMPAVTFGYDEMANRMDKDGDGQEPFYKSRLTAIADEVGGQVDVTYSPEACSPSALPSPQTNTTRCFPQMRKPGPNLDPVTDWFNKYVVTEVVTTDRTETSPDQVTRYEYLGGGAWHFDESTGMVPEEEKTWSDWRGYGQVRTTTGSATQQETQSDAWFLRGMPGQKAKLESDEGAEIVDAEQYAGFTYKTATYSAPDGAVVSKTVNRPWWHQTAISERSWGDLKSGFNGTSHTKAWTSLGTGGAPWRTTEQYQSYDTVAGRITKVDDRGDTALTTDDRCVSTSYATSTSRNILGLHARQQTWGVACSATPNRAGGDVISDVRYAYDGASYGTAPTIGRITGAADLAGYEGTTARYVEAATTYDTYGRPTSVTDVAADVHVTSSSVLTRTARTDGHKTTTAYTPATGFATQMVETSPPATPGAASSALTTTTHLDARRGVPTRVTDTNGKATNVTYDALGRTSKVWLADRVITQTPSMQYAYKVTGKAAPAVGTTSLNSNGDPRTSWTLYDGLLRPVQTQAPGQRGGMILADTMYDSRGLVSRTYNPYYTTSATAGVLFDPYDSAVVDGQVRTSYDGLGRPVQSKLMRNDGDGGEVMSTTRTVYRGDRTTVIPPQGGTATTALVDARGRTTELRQHHDRATAAPADTTGLDATKYTYTGRDELKTVVDPAGNRWEYTYDQRGRQVSTKDPDAGTTTSTYDDFGQVTSTTDAAGHTLVTTYDGLGRRTGLRDDSATGALRASWTYDTLPGAKGQLASSTRHEGGAQYSTQVLEYDRLYRATRSRVVIPATEGKLAGNYTTVTSYGPDGSVSGLGLPAAGALPGQTAAYDIDPDTGWVLGMIGPEGISSTSAYDNVGRLTHMEMDGDAGELITATYAFDRTTDRLTEYRADRFLQPGIDRTETYTYDEAGNVLSLADVSRTGTDVQCYDYDHLRRLTEAWTQRAASCAGDGAAAKTAGTLGGPAPYWQEWTYDKAGSRLTETQHGIAGSSTPGDIKRSYQYGTAQPHTVTGVTQDVAASGTNPAVKSQETYTYDKVGQTTARQINGDSQTLAWSPEGRVQEVTNADDSGVEYVYDADGNRLLARTSSGAGTETTLYLGHTEVTVNNAAPTVAKATRYIDVGGGHTAVVDDDRTVSFVLADHQGTGQLSIRADTMALSQRRTTPFGADRGTAPTQWAGSRSFVGGYDDRDTTGLVSLGAREYDPALGRFVSLDPVMDLTDPQQIHGYSYANNNPVTWSDPTGLKWDDCAWQTCKTTSGGGWAVTNPTSEHVDNDYQDGDPSDDCHSGCIPAGSLGGSGSTSGGGGSATNTGSTGAATSAPAESETARAQRVLDRSVTDVALELGWEALKDFVGWNDLVGCLEKDLGACGGLALGIVPVGKGLKAIKALYKVIDGAISFYKEVKWARGVISRARSTSTVGGACAINSFVPGTLVLLADGTSKPIEDVQLGDQVLATDETTGKSEPQAVVALITGDGDKDLVTLTVTDAHGDIGSVTATDGHPFWVPALDEWVDAGDLKPGQWLQTAAGTHVQLTAIETTRTRARVHNLTISGSHTYYVTATEQSLLSHNESCPRDTLGRFTSGENADAARGRATHLNYRDALGGGYDYEVRLDSGRRPDAVNWATREVRELKSDAPSSMARGRRQLQGYVSELESMTGQPWTGHLDIYSR